MGLFNREFLVTQIRVSMSGWKCQGMNMNIVCENSNKKKNTEKNETWPKTLRKEIKVYLRTCTNNSLLINLCPHILNNLLPLVSICSVNTHNLLFSLSDYTV